MLPELFRIGPVSVHSYGLALDIAFLLGAFLALRQMKKRGMDSSKFIDVLLFIIVGALVGSRIVFCALEYGYYLAHPLQILRLDLGGLSFHGGVAGGALAGWFGVRRARLKFWPVADIITPSLALGYSIVRIGCFLNGCCYGVPTSVPWAVNFYDVPRHPTQIYDSALSLVVYGALVLAGRRPPFPGFVWWLFVGLYSVQRFVVEFWREGVHIAGWLTVGQAASIVLAVVASLAAWAGYRRAARDARAARADAGAGDGPAAP